MEKNVVQAGVLYKNLLVNILINNSNMLVNMLVSERG